MAVFLNCWKIGQMSTVYKASTLFCNPSVLINPAASYASSSKIYKNLGIPERPKRPANAYARYLSKRLTGLKLNIEERREKFKEIATEWKQLNESEPQTYKNDYAAEKAKYEDALAAWNATLSPEQKAEVEQVKKDVKLNKNERADSRETAADKRKTAAEAVSLGKPSKPLTGFLSFLKKVHQEQQLKMPEAATLWRDIPESEKDRYNQPAKEAHVIYQKALLDWELKMLKKGRADLVRKSTIAL